MYRQVRIAVLAVASLLAASPALAQGPRTTSLGIHLGLSVPTGDAADFYEAGYVFGGMLELKAPTSPIALRGEVGHQAFERKGIVGGNQGITSAGATIALHMQGIAARPYLLGGLAGYFGDDETNVGINGGIGIEVPLTGFSTLFEARIVNIFNGLGSDRSLRTIPITVGLRF